MFNIIYRDDESIIYNLAFGDKDKNSGELDDLVVSANGDTEKVLSTKVAAVVLFYTCNKNRIFGYMQQVVHLPEHAFIVQVSANIVKVKVWD